MKTFDLKRFWNLQKWVLVYDRKRIFTMTCTIFLVYILSFFVNKAFTVEQNQFDMIRLCSFSEIAFCLYMIFSGINILANMNTKQQIIAYKMLPATDFEKFLARYLMITVVRAAIGIAMFLLADVVRMVIYPIYTGVSAQSLIPFVIDSLNIKFPGELAEYGIDLILMVYLVPVLFHSAYMFGGVLFRRNKFAFTSLALFLLTVAFVKVQDMFDKNTFGVSVGLDGDDINALDVLFAIGIVFDYVMSYILFKRMQVINNKWLNL